MPKQWPLDLYRKYNVPVIISTQTKNKNKESEPNKFPQKWIIVFTAVNTKIRQIHDWLEKEKWFTYRASKWSKSRKFSIRVSCDR